MIINYLNQGNKSITDLDLQGQSQKIILNNSEGEIYNYTSFTIIKINEDNSNSPIIEK